MLVLLAALAFLVRLVPVLRGGGLDSLIGYDDGVYFAAAIALLHGELPYRDLLLLHPPGILILLAPFAAAGGVIGDANAMAIARVTVMALGAANTFLAGLVAGAHDRRAGVLAAALFATWNVAVISERTTDLHAPQHTMILGALAVLGRRGRIGWRRALVAGALVGLAMTVQLWQGATLLVLAWWAGARAPVGRARVVPALALLTGAGTVFVLTCGPFFAAAPQAMIANVVLDQLGRPHTGVRVADRLLVLLGGAPVSSLPAALRPLAPIPLVLAVAGAGLTLLIATAWRRTWTRPWVAAVIVQGSIVLSTPSFYVDYPGFLAPTGSLALGTGLSMAIGAFRGRGIARRAIVATVAVLVAALTVVAAAIPRGQAVPLDELRADVVAARCVSGDSPTLLVMTGALRRNAERGCAIVVDPTGVSYHADRGRKYPRGANWRRHAPLYQQAMLEWYTSGDVALFARLHADDLTASTRAAIRRALPMAHAHGDVVVRSKEGQ